MSDHTAVRTRTQDVPNWAFLRSGPIAFPTIDIFWCDQCYWIRWNILCGIMCLLPRRLPTPIIYWGKGRNCNRIPHSHNVMERILRQQPTIIKEESIYILILWKQQRTRLHLSIFISKGFQSMRINKYYQRRKSKDINDYQRNTTIWYRLDQRVQVRYYSVLSMHVCFLPTKRRKNKARRGKIKVSSYIKEEEWGIPMINGAPPR